MVGIVIPAHNEAAVITGLLRGLLPPDGVAADIVVVCNACTDDTAGRARSVSPRIEVRELDIASKPAAMALGDATTTRYPRIYVDADVELTWADVEALSGPLLRGPALAAAPARELVLDSSPWLVRAYYDVWSRLPQVRTGLFGRGVVALSAAGHARVHGRPLGRSDDLVLSEAFAPHERVVVTTATVRVHAPRTVADLVRRRVRVVLGTADVDAEGLRSAQARTTPRSLLTLVAQNPRSTPQVAAFLAVTLAARVIARARRATGTDAGWLRDESSRHR